MGAPVLLPLSAILLQKGLPASPSRRDGFLGTAASGTIYPLPKALKLPWSMFKKPLLCCRPCREPRTIHRESDTNLPFKETSSLHNDLHDTLCTVPSSARGPPRIGSWKHLASSAGKHQIPGVWAHGEERLVEVRIGGLSFSEGPTGSDPRVLGVFGAIGWTGARNGPCPGGPGLSWHRQDHCFPSRDYERGLSSPQE